MRFPFLCLMAVSLLFVGCRQPRAAREQTLSKAKESFLNALISSHVEEGPFAMSYSIETVFFSKNFISLYGQLDVRDCLPHSWHRYEGKTFLTVNGRIRKISLDELFTQPSQKEFLRSCCEEALKKDPNSYFFGIQPLKTRLEVDELQTFVIDHQSLIVLFQPYVVGGGVEKPFFVKIPFEKLTGHWDSNNIVLPLLSQVIASKDFVIANGMFTQKEGWDGKA
jgi:hypothetical protein